MVISAMWNGGNGLTTTIYVLVLVDCLIGGDNVIHVM